MKILKKIIMILMMIFGTQTTLAKSEDFSKIKLEDVNGKIYSFSTEKKEVYVKLWASWCPICLSGLEDLETLSQQEKNFEIVTIVFPDKKGEKNKEDFKKWYKSLPYKNIKVLLDVNGDVLKILNPRVYPTSLVLDKESKIKKIIPGHLEKKEIEKIFHTESMEDKKMKSKNKNSEMMDKNEMMSKKDIQEIYLAGGCFWGLEAYMEKIYGVEDAISGYANGNTKNPSYEDLIYKNSGHAETVYVKYNKNEISLDTILKYYFKVVDPTSLNKQGNDRGKQYRSGIYYVNESDKKIIENAIKEEQKKYTKKVVVEVLPLSNFYKAEEYHQDYLKKNPHGYCHIDLSKANDIIIDKNRYPKLSKEKLKEKLTKKEYGVTQLSETERAFQNDYWDFFEDGIYVDITTGEPLFSSKDKYKSFCGWPSFTKAIVPEVVTYHEDNSYNMKRVEVRSRSGEAHLGHIFEDGPKEHGGKRYCINSAALKFIPLKNMEKDGYGYLIPLVK